MLQKRERSTKQQTLAVDGDQMSSEHGWFDILGVVQTHTGTGHHVIGGDRYHVK